MDETEVEGPAAHAVVAMICEAAQNKSTVRASSASMAMAMLPSSLTGSQSATSGPDELAELAELAETAVEGSVEQPGDVLRGCISVAYT
jgi:hypothetical protein